MPDTARVSCALESDAYRTRHDRAQLDAAIANHSGKLDDLFGQVRSLAHEVHAEVVPRLDRIDGRLDRLEADVAELKTDVAELKGSVYAMNVGVGALLAHFQITPPAGPA